MHEGEGKGICGDPLWMSRILFGVDLGSDFIQEDDKERTSWSKGGKAVNSICSGLQTKTQLNE